MNKRLFTAASALLLTACFAKPARGPVPMDLARSLAQAEADTSTAQPASVTLTLDVGSEEDPIGFEGLAMTTAQSVLQTAQALDPISVRRVKVTVDRTEFQVVCVRDGSCGEALIEALLKPTFSAPSGRFDQSDLVPADVRVEQLIGLAFHGRPQSHPPRGRTTAAPLSPAAQALFAEAHYLKARTRLRTQGPDAAERLEDLTAKLSPLSDELPVRVAPLSAAPLSKTWIALVQGDHRVMLADRPLRRTKAGAEGREQHARQWASAVASVRTMTSWDHHQFHFHWMDTALPSTADGLQVLLEEMALVSDQQTTPDVRSAKAYPPLDSADFRRYQNEPRMILLTTPDPASVRDEIEEMLGEDVRDYTITVIGGEP